MDKFKETLYELELTKAQLSRELGVSMTSVYRWRGEPPPYVWAYLREKLKTRSLTSMLMDKIIAQ